MNAVQKPSPKTDLLTQIIIYELPFSLFILFFLFYNFGFASPTEFTKTFGLMAITLLAFTLLINPLANYFPIFARFRSAGKPWGIACVLCVVIHLALVLVYRYNFDLIKMFDPSKRIFWGLITGFISFFALLYKLFNPVKKSFSNLPNSIWKNLITVTYLALILAFVHFYLVESTASGVLVIKKLLGQIIFGFSGFVVLLRLVLHFISYRKTKNN